MKHTKFLIALVMCIALTINSFSQTSEIKWQFYDEINGIQFFYKYAECHDTKNDKHIEYVLLQMINTTSETMDIEWKRDMWYNGNCMNCDSDDPEYIHKYTLKPSETFSTDCDSKFRGTKIFSKFLKFKGPELTKFEITKIKVTPK